MEIYGTIGPSCSDTEVLAEMFLNGMTGIRLNLSHMTLTEAESDLAAFQTAAAVCGITAPKLIIDLQGPELRIGKMGALELKDGDLVPMDLIPFPEEVRQLIHPGQDVLLDDGKILLEASEIITDGSSSPRQMMSVLRGGRLTSRKNLALPGLDLRPPTLTDSDFLNLSLARQYGVTGIMQPFVRDANDLMAVQEALWEADAGHVRLFAKIENQEGVDHLEELLPYADEIVIARGDLGNNMPLWEVPRIQKYISSVCRDAGKPFMVVTELLSSMEYSPIPTRAEVSDIYNAVLDGAASLMLTGETAIGQYPAEAISYLTKTVREVSRT